MNYLIPFTKLLLQEFFATTFIYRCFEIENLVNLFILAWILCRVKNDIILLWNNNVVKKFRLRRLHSSDTSKLFLKFIDIHESCILESYFFISIHVHYFMSFENNGVINWHKTMSEKWGFTSEVLCISKCYCSDIIHVLKLVISLVCNIR